MLGLKIFFDSFVAITFVNKYSNNRIFYFSPPTWNSLILFAFTEKKKKTSVKEQFGINIEFTIKTTIKTNAIFLNEQFLYQVMHDFIWRGKKKELHVSRLADGE